jgi:hypothetical protein
VAAASSSAIGTLNAESFLNAMAINSSGEKPPSIRSESLPVDEPGNQEPPNRVQLVDADASDRLNHARKRGLDNLADAPIIVEEDVAAASGNKRPKNNDDGAICPISCVTCLTQLNPRIRQCYRCGGDPFVIRVFAESYPANASGVNSSAAASTSNALAVGLNQASSCSTAALPTTSSAASMASGQSWLSKGSFHPLSNDAIEALRDGKFKDTSYYLPRRVSVFAITKQDDAYDIMLKDGKVVAKPSVGASKEVRSFEELYLAHTEGIMMLLAQFDDFHRTKQYNSLWAAVMRLRADDYPFSILFYYYETSRNRHPGVNDNVGEFDSDVWNQVQLQMARYRANSIINMQARASGFNFTPGTSRYAQPFSSGPRDRNNRSRRSNNPRVCMAFNDLKCNASPCPDKLPHLCCRCFEEHAANSGLCPLPDPRNRDLTGPRGTRGGRNQRVKSGDSGSSTASSSN